MRSLVAGYPAGRERSQPALNGGAHALTDCALPSATVRERPWQHECPADGRP